MLGLTTKTAEVPTFVTALLDASLWCGIAIVVATVLSSLCVKFFVKGNHTESLFPIFAVSSLTGLLLIGSSLALRAAIADMQKESDPKPTPEPDAQVIALPKFENLDTLWFILITAVAVIIALTLGLRAYRKKQQGRQTTRAQNAQLAAQWDTYKSRHQDVILAYLDAETNWDTLFDQPALTDPADPVTAKMLQAMRVADITGDEMPVGIDETTTLALLAYPQAVEHLAQCWELAKKNARLIGQQQIPSDEQKLIKKIKSLLAIAESPGAADNERQIAYKQAHRMIGQLTSVRIPTTALAAIEKKLALTLEPA